MQASELRLVRPQAKEPGDGNGGQGSIEAPSSLRLSPAELRRRCDPASLPFTSTTELEPLEGPVGQPRAIEALELAMAIAAPGYNAFVVGPHGMGKHAVLRALLERTAELKTAPSDWCYVHNFERPHEPSALELPHGRGRALAADMKKLIVPKSNATSLMLREDVVEACAAGRFHVYAVETGDEAIELLTGVPAGKEDEHGDFPEESVNGKITAQLLQFAAIAESFGKMVQLWPDEDEDDD